MFVIRVEIPFWYSGLLSMAVSAGGNAVVGAEGSVVSSGSCVLASALALALASALAGALAGALAAAFAAALAGALALALA